MPIPSPFLSQFAAAEFRRRQSLIQAEVTAGKMDRLRGEAALRPWFAIACMAWADLPEINEATAQIAVRQIFPTSAHMGVTEAEARQLVAEHACRPSTMRAELSRARDAVCAQAEAPGATSETIERAVNLTLLASDLGCKPRVVPAPAAQTERKAA